MTLRSRLFPGDDELGNSKRDDDFNSHRRSTSTASDGWPVRRPYWLRRSRILAMLAVCFLIAFIVYNLATLGTADPRLILDGRPKGRARPGSSFIDRAWAKQYNPNTPQEAPAAPARGARPPGSPAGSSTSTDVEERSFEGPVRFFYLASSLHGIARTSGHQSNNRNILFAASDLKSAGLVIPLACEMAKWRLNFVHFAFMGRDEISLDEIKKLNNADRKANCDIYWHDARPDYASFSTDRRMEVSAAGALGHMENFMHPQAVITAGTDSEDDFFARAIAYKTKELHQTHIELPAQELESLSWLTRLEAKALNSWHSASIDIVVQAPQETSGSLIRLLKSLARADYGGFVPPRLTLEMPHKLHDDTMAFIDSFLWPPLKYQPHLPTSQLTLRRRIPDRRLSEEEASFRFVESFYPTHTENSHVLVLSPQAELSPAYFHYLKYHMLEWRYGGVKSDELMGISLETPSTHLNGTDGFDPPVADIPMTDDRTPITSFLWQAPNSNAALFFADKWVEFHSFLTGHHISKRHPRTREHVAKRDKQLSKKFPAWTEQMLELMRTRGYFMAFPSAIDDPTQSSSPAVIHNELFQAPEEWLRPQSDKGDKDLESPAPDDVLEAPADYLAAHQKSTEQDSAYVERGLLKALRLMLRPAPAFGSGEEVDPNSLPDPIPTLAQLTLLDYAGDQLSIKELIAKSDDYAVTFRKADGGCSDARANPDVITLGHADDLFCLEDFVDPNAKAPASEEPGAVFRAAVESLPTDAKKAGKPTAADPLGKSVAPAADVTAKPSPAEPLVPTVARVAPTSKDSPAPDDGLTDIQRAELEDWRAKQRKDSGEIADAPRFAPPSTRADPEPGPLPRATADIASALANEEFLNGTASEKRPDPDDLRPVQQRPVKTDADAAAVAAEASPRPPQHKGATKGRLRGWDQGGFDESVRDEFAAAAAARGGAAADDASKEP